MQRTKHHWAAPVFLLAMLSALGAHAQEPPPTVVFNVNSVADLVDDNVNDGICRNSANTCSLRAALMQANHLNTARLIVTIDVPAGVYLLTRPPGSGADESDGDLDLGVPPATGQSIVISGAAAATTIIDANHSDRVLDIAPGRVAVIVNLTLRHGNRDSGGGISMSSGALTIRDCVIQANQAENDGGGIFNGFGTLNVVRSTIASNIAGDAGGGIYSSGPAQVRESTVHGNGAEQGGGVRNSDVLIVVNSTFSGNYAYGDGGGINNQDRAFLYNTSVVDNDANHQSVIFGAGGGVFNAGSRFLVANTLIVGNTNHGSFPRDCDGELEAYGWNLLGTVSNCTIPATAAWGFITRDMLGPLRDNGGPTPTHALLAGSRAIDTTDILQGCVDQAGMPLAADQRGLPRVAGARCDVGAYEYGAGVVFENSFE